MVLLVCCTTSPGPKPNPSAPGPSTTSSPKTTRVASAPIKGPFAIHLLKSVRGPLGYDLTNAWRTLKSTPIENNTLFSITESDIALYDWPAQEIYLTQRSAERFRAILLPGKRLSHALEMRPFVVTLGDQRLFGGVVLYLMSARGIGYPVLYIDETPKAFKLSLRPYQGGINNYRDSRQTMKPAMRQRIEFTAVRDRFRKLGKLEP